MRALILAAGRGERMRPLTDTTPKPLLEVHGKPLIVYHLERLATCGIRDVVINTAWLAEQFPARLGDGSRWGLAIHYSNEGPTALETGGGMLHALPLLGTEPFLAVNGDIFTDFDFATLPRKPRSLAHLVMVDDPPHHPDGDFALLAGGRLSAEPNAGPRLTFAGVGVYRREFIATWRGGIKPTATDGGDAPRFPLAPLLRHAMASGQVRGQHHHGTWSDVGTPERLTALNT